LTYTVRQLAQLAGVSVRTLHYYDQVGLLKPGRRTANGYRVYTEKAVLPLQQIMFYRELGFSLEEIRDIMKGPDYDVPGALRGHRGLMLKKAERIDELLATVDRTTGQLKGEQSMGIEDYYQGLDEKQIEAYRTEVRERWGEETLRDSEARVMSMGKEGLATAQAEGATIFQAIADNSAKGHDSPEVQEQIAKWRKWLVHFYSYSDEAVRGLGQMYSQDPRFAESFRKYGDDFPSFLTNAIEHYCASNQ